MLLLLLGPPGMWAPLWVKERTTNGRAVLLPRAMRVHAPCSPAALNDLPPSPTLNPCVSPGLQLYQEQATESGAVYLFFTPRGGWVKLLGYDFSGACCTAARHPLPMSLSVIPPTVPPVSRILPSGPGLSHAPL